jgi:hypothetical protein
LYNPRKPQGEKVVKKYSTKNTNLEEAGIWKKKAFSISIALPCPKRPVKMEKQENY